MTDFVIAIAGKRIGVCAIYESTRLFCRDYWCQETPDFSVVISQTDLDYERAKSEQENIAEGIPVQNYPDAYLETLAVYRKICTRLLEHDTLLFHGSAVAVDGVAYLFTAQSGTGKSTHTALWRKTFGERAVMVNDDKPLLKLTQDGVTVCGTPWNGKHRLGTNVMVPLKAICILERAEENHIQRITPAQALPALMQQAYRPEDRNALVKLIGLIGRMTEKLEFYRLGCNMEPEAALVSYTGMNQPK